jgi:hypothetical protein
MQFKTDENTNIDKKPNVEEAPISIVAVGDLHGNFSKFLYGLVRNGIIEISSENYKRLTDLYHNIPGSFKPEHKVMIQEFELLIESAITLRNKNASVILIGDETADRGNNDYYTLLLLRKLKHLQRAQGEKGNTKIIFSNHGAEFVRAYEKYGKIKNTLCPENIADDQAASLVNLGNLIKSGLVEWDDVKTIINEIYKPALKLLDYHLNETLKEFYLFSHAPIDFSCIVRLIGRFGLSEELCDICTPQSMATVIDQINAAFQKYVQEDRVHELYEITDVGCIEDGAYLSQQDIIVGITWNRRAPLQREPKHFNDWTTYYVHGHHARRAPKLNETTVYNLDDHCGKMPSTYWHSGQSFKYVTITANAPAVQQRMTLTEFCEQYAAFKNSELLVDRLQRFNDFIYPDWKARTVTEDELNQACLRLFNLSTLDALIKFYMEIDRIKGEKLPIFNNHMQAKQFIDQVIRNEGIQTQSIENCGM